MLNDKLLQHRAAMRAAAELNIPLFLRTKNTKSIDDVLNEHIALVTKSLTQLKSDGKTAEEKMTELRSEITELSQKFAAGGIGGRGDDMAVTVGSRFIQERGADLAKLAEDRGEVSLSLRAAVTSGSTSAGALAQAHRDGVIMLPRRKLMIRDILPVIRVSSGSVEYPKQEERAKNAAPVAEGQLKPESEPKWTLKNVPMRTIAHYVMASRQILEDAPQLEGLINEDLVFGLRDKEDEQLAMGDGTGENITGLYPNATEYAAPYALTAANKMDRIGSALLQLALADCEPDGVIVHPSDWLRMKLLKDAGGGYITADPITGKVGGNETQRPMLWGLPVIPSKAMTVGNFLVGDFRRAATLYDRWDVRLEASTQDRDNFIRNLATILCEERIGLAIKHKPALVRGSYAADA